MTHVNLGDGHLAVPVWQAGVDREHAIPAGIVFRHGAHAAYVAWAEAPGPYAVSERWDLDSLFPLTITPGIVCPGCGVEGLVEDGRWVEVATSAGRREG